MKKLILVSIAVLLLASCKQAPISSSREGTGVEVELLFEKDSVKVYRFWDNSSYHYFTSKGETISTQQSGKTHYEENIN